MLYRKLVPTILFVFTITLLKAQTTAGLPKAVLTNKAGNSVSTASISDFDNPVIVITYSESWCSGCVKLITELDNNYSSLGTSSGVKIYAVNVDRSLTSTEVFSKASRWKNVEVLYDKSQEFTKALYSTSAPFIFFLDDNQQVIYNHTSYALDIKKAYKLASQIKQKEILARKIFYDKDWFPCPEKDAVYYRLISKTSDNKWNITDYYKNGTLQMQGQAILPFPLVRQGKYQYYHPDGKLSSETTYQENSPTGRSTGYYNNGKTQFDYTYVNGKLEGKWTRYHANGKVSNTGMYQAGSPNGVFYHYYESGKKRKETNWAYGKMHGKCTGWYESGKLKFEADFNEGIINNQPAPKYFHENGQSAFEVKKNGENETLIYMNDKGIVTLLLEQTGTLYELALYDDNNVPVLKATLKDHQTVNGKYIIWYENGQKKLESTFYNNEPSGKAVGWYDNGVVKEKIDFTNNTKEYFDRQGNKVSSITDPSIKIDKGQKLNTQYITDKILQLGTIIRDDGKEG
jgi:antitoxin component YwqK of YwqJK toxin-antitoxin module/peroxiredoxin